MSYIGPKPSQTLATPTSQYFNGTGSQTVFTLNRAVNVPEDLEVFVNNIQQEPGVGKSYTATGTTLTFDGAPSSGTANVYVVYRGLAEVTTRLEHDPNAALAATTGTFSGDLTVDTNTLYVDSTNNLVGIGTSSPTSQLSFGANIGRDVAVYEGAGGANKYGIGMSGDGSGGDPFRTKIYANGVESVSITSGGAVGIGTSTPDFKAEIVGGTNDGLHIKDAESATVFGGLFTQASNMALVARSNHDLTFGTNDTERWRINTAGHMVPANTNNGIILGSTASVASNLLNDYEEGTFTPTIGLNSGGTTVTYTAQVGFYTKVGNIVHALVQVANSSHNSTTSGALWRIGGLPFTTDSSDAGGYFAYNNNNGDIWGSGRANNGSTYVLIYGSYPSSASTHMTITYRTNS